MVSSIAFIPFFHVSSRLKIISFKTMYFPTAFFHALIVAIAYKLPREGSVIVLPDCLGDWPGFFEFHV